MNYALYETLQQYTDSAQAAFVLGGPDAVFAALLIRFALAAPSPSDEEKLALQLRDLTYTSLVADAERLEREVKDIAHDARALGRGVRVLYQGLGEPLSLVADLLSNVRAERSQDATDAASGG